MKRVPLTRFRNQVVAYALVDDDDFSKVKNFNWGLHQGYARSTIPGANGRRQLLHRMVMGLTPDGLQKVDHVNRDKLDCRKANLRFATQAENLQNQGARNEIPRGVWYSRSRRRWIAQVQLNRRKKWLGQFQTMEEAAQVASEWRKKNMPFAVEH